MASSLYQNLVIVADDFTGSNDTGVQFKKKGYNTVVVNKNFNVKNKINSDVIVVNTDSRLIESIKAKKIISDTISNLKSTFSSFYKKIDSTFRGNVGDEIEAMLDTLGVNICVVAAALPDVKRTTLDGKCFVDGVEVDKTDFANDPITPVRSSIIKDILDIKGNYEITNISLEDIHSKKFDKLFLDSFNNNSKHILICDSNTNEDLLLIAETTYKYLDKILCVGSAGFANALSSKFLFLPTCLISGSVSSVSSKQLEYVSKNDNVAMLDIDRDLFFSGKYDELAKYLIEQIMTAIEAKKHVLFSISKCKNDIQENHKHAEKYSIDENNISKYISKSISKVFSLVLKDVKFRALFINGGDTAINLMEEVCCDTVNIFGEMLTGIPYGIMESGLYKGLYIATKAGGFGQDDAMVAVLDFYDK